VLLLESGNHTCERSDLPEQGLTLTSPQTYIFSFFTFLMFIGTYGQLVGMGTLASYLL
jgi:hypothetical protein